MSPEKPPELDPEVLADPVDEPDESGPEAPPDVVEISPENVEEPAEQAGPPASTALVPAKGQGLVPFDPFRRYLAELRKYPPLSREDEQRLARIYRDTGDREALFQLVTANLMMVVRVAHSFHRAARNLLDLVQEGNLGLLHALERFDPELGVRLPTYAAWWVRAYMVKFLLDNVRLVRVGTTNARRKLLRNLRKEKARLEEQGYDVGTKLLAEHFGVSETDVREVEQALVAHDVSIDAPLGDEGSPTAAETLPTAEPTAEEQVARHQLQEQAEVAITRFKADLGERDLALLQERILAESPLTLQAIGDRFGTSREAVRQAEARLMKRLSEFLKQELGELGDVKFGH